MAGRPLRSLVAGTVPPDLAAPSELAKVSHQVPLDPPPMAAGEDRELHLQPAANAERPNVTYVAQQLDRENEDVEDVFGAGDALDQLLPGTDLLPDADSLDSAVDDLTVPEEPTDPAVAEPTPTAPRFPAEFSEEEAFLPDSPSELPPELQDLENGVRPPSGLPSANGLPRGPQNEPIDVLPEGDVDSTPLNETFDRFDCENEIEVFQQAWEELRSKPLRSISLDITPTLRPGEPEQKQEIRQQILDQAVDRTWHDHRGRVLVTGRLRDYRDGKVLVEDSSGSVAPVSWYDLSNEDLCYVSSVWELPKEFSPSSEEYAVRNWTMLTFTWTASALCHKPLYFEEVQLERYGHSAGPVKQAMLSGVHFFGNIIMLPYHMGVNPPNECQYALGYYRPGSCAPWLLPAYPLSARGTRWQVAALVGGMLLLP